MKDSIQGFFVPLNVRSARKHPKGTTTTNRRSGPRAEKPAEDFKIYQERGCDGCTLCSNDLTSPKMKPTGDPNPDIYILGESPGEFEDQDGEQFVGRSGKLLRGTLKQVGLTTHAIRWDNCCRCRPPQNRTPTREELERCRLRIQRSIERAQPKVLVAVGGTALLWALGESSILKWRGRLIPIRVGEHECWLYPILHPAFIIRSGGVSKYEEAKEDWKIVFHKDLAHLFSLIEEGLPDPDPEPLDSLDQGIRYAIDRQTRVEWVNQMRQWQKDEATIAFDIETTRLRPYDKQDVTSQWLSIAFSDGETTWAVPVSHDAADWGNNLHQCFQVVSDFLGSGCLKIAHNLAFEMEWMYRCFGVDTSWKRTRWGDTMEQSYILDERLGNHSLDDCVLRNFGFRLKSHGGVTKKDKANMGAVSLNRLLKYNGMDAKYTARLYHIQKAQLVRESLLDTYKMQISRCITLVKTQIKGLLVHQPTVANFQAKLQKKIEVHLEEIQNSDEAKLYEKKIGKPLSPSSAVQLTVLFRDLLHRPEGERKKNKSGYSVDDKALSAMDIPMADAILELRSLRKNKSTYVDACSAGGGLVGFDGRLHTNFNDTGTVTGRLSSDSPNVQNMPKREDAWIRGMVVVPKNHVMVSSDYGQIEPRVIACSSRDETLCKAIREKYDIHGDWAARIAKIDSRCYVRYDRDIKKLRQDVKSNWVLAGFYGADYGTISARLGGLKRQCEDLFDDFKNEFAGVWRWQEEQIRLYHERGYVEGMTGRRRRAPLSVNQILNNVTQGTASDIVMSAMDRLSRRADREDEPALQPVLNVHDDISFYVPKDRQDELTEVIVKEMLTITYDWVCVPLSVEIAAGHNWADLQKVETYFSDEV